MKDKTKARVGVSIFFAFAIVSICASYGIMNSKMGKQFYNSKNLSNSLYSVTVSTPQMY